MKTLLRDAWEFVKTPITAEDVLPERPPESGRTAVTIPHDWLIWDTNDLYESSLGWYCTHFESAPEDETTYLYFEGVYMDSTVYVNGVKAGEWKYGYQSFYLDVTDLVKAGSNELWVRVCHLAPNSRWYSGAGIFRPVYQIVKKKQHILPDRTACAAKEDGEGFDVSFRTAVTEPGQLRVTVLDAEGKTAGRGEGSSEEPVRFRMFDVRRWSLEDPYLYTVQAELLNDGEVKDQIRFNYGFRSWRFDPDKGFFLNGKNIKLKGVCLHHDLGLLGAAFHPDAARRQLELMQKMGVNAVRTSHNMPAPAFLDICDEMGFVVMDEFIDMWRQPKTTYDYARFWDEWVERDVANWIRRDRLHPSVMMWSIGNEIYDTHGDPHGIDTMKYLMEQVRRHDPEEHAAITLGSNYMAWENTQKCADVIKLIGYNYSERLYEEHHKAHPDWMIYGSETCSTLQSRGIYHFPLEQPVLTNDDQQCSVLGNCTTTWGAKNIPFILEFEAKTPYSAGQFIWTGIDYIGEPTPYQTKNSYFGMADTACLPKDAYYLFQAAWVPAEKQTVLHLYPYWDWNPGQMIDLLAASNAAEVEVRVNGRSLGRQKLDAAAGKVLAKFRAPYEEGSVEAIAYDAHGREIACDVRKSFGDAAEICLEAENSGRALGPGQLAYVTISMKDKNGVPVANANNEVLVEVTGPGQLLGLDNGDSTDFDPYKTNERRLFSGKLLAMIEPFGEGKIEVKVSSPGLRDAVLELEAAAGDYPAPMQPSIRREPSVPGNVPIRKAELRTEAPLLLRPENKHFTVEAKLFPANATYRDVDWRVTNLAGADSLTVKSKKDPADPSKLQLEVLGDGDFTVRCLPKNGRDYYAFISSLQFKAEGFGAMLINPYLFNSGSLCTAKSSGVSSGLERGIATAPHESSWVAFENMNFGDFGSDTLYMPTFSNDKETRYRIWRGLPGEEGSELLLDEVRDVTPVWNTYQDMYFKLPKRLKGIQTLAVETETIVHIKGLSFEKQEKAFSELRAAEAEDVYGDRFSKEDVWVRNIGNNVSLVFGEMDFGEKGTAALKLCASSKLELNSIHLLFEGAEGSKRELLEFRGPTEEKEATFRFAPRYGVQKVSLMFLPGSDIDLKSICFLPQEKEE